MRTLVAGDFHIGGGGNTDAILRFLEMAKGRAQFMILGGDVLDLWFATWDEIKSNTAYLALLDTVQKVPTVIIRGNHDFYLAEWQVPGATIVDEYSKDGAYYIHGWQYDSVQVVLRPLFPIISRFLPRLARLLRKNGTQGISRLRISKILNLLFGVVLIPFFPFIIGVLPQLYRLVGLKPFYKCWERGYIYFNPKILWLLFDKKLRRSETNKPIPVTVRLIHAAEIVWLESGQSQCAHGAHEVDT